MLVAKRCLGEQLSKKKRSKTKWLQDQIMADMVLTMPLGREYTTRIERLVDSALAGRQIGTLQQRARISSEIPEIMEKYFALRMTDDRPRASIKKAFQKLKLTLSKASESVLAVTDEEYRLLLRLSSIRGTKVSNSSSIEIPQVNILRGELGLSLALLSGAAGDIEKAFDGGTQQHTLALRYLVFKALERWLRAGLPRPHLVWGADPNKYYSPDPDVFSELIHLITDDQGDSRPSRDAVRLQVRDALERSFPVKIVN